jgi:putative salt-induced outer membrane protein
MKQTLRSIPVLLALIFVLTTTAYAGELVYIEGMDDRAEVSYANTNGNTDTTTVSGRIKVSRYINEFKVSMKGAVLRTESDGQETEDKLKLELWGERDITDKLFALGSVSYLRDTFAGYNFRIFIGPGIGYTFIDSEVKLLQGIASVLYNYDDYSSGVQGTEENVSLKLSGRYSQHITETISFKELLDYTVALDDMGRYFVDSETRFEAKLNETFSFGLSFIINYQNEPPSAGVDNTDTTLFTSLIANF